MGRVIVYSSLILIGIFSCTNRDQFHDMQEIISKTKETFAPDYRTAIFEVDIIKSKPVKLQGETNLPEAKIYLLEILTQRAFEFEDHISILPNYEIGEDKFGIINVSVANLRANPKHSSELVTQALLGMPVIILKQMNGWLLVQTPDQYIAWTNAGSLERINQVAYDLWKNAKKLIYLNTYGFAVNHDGTERIADLVAGNIVKLENDAGKFWEVEYPDGRKAKIAKDEAKELEKWIHSIAITPASITAEAKQLTGIPYLWGGTSTKGLDCSGFTKSVYFLHGFILPRDASQQVHTGHLIDTVRDFSKLQVGDLLFFGKKNDDLTERVVHVGIWLGNNQFIHASEDVHISSMDSLDENFDRYNYDRYLRTKRIFGSDKSVKSIIDYF